MARKEANLEIILIAQDFLPEHWNWTPQEKAYLGDVAEMGKIIKTRLEADGCVVIEMYAVKHDKDEQKLWNEQKMVYEIKFTSNHGHFVIKLKKGTGKILSAIAALIGLEPNFIEKPKRGRYAYDNMLSYLIHIKYDKKYQYHVSDVYTIVGKPYAEYYAERREAWLRGRAVKSIADARRLLEPLKYKLAKGEITIGEIIQNEEYRDVYILYADALEKVAERKKRVDMILKDYPEWEKRYGK